MVDVSCGVIRKDGKILIARRKKGTHMENRWEFPGGKIEPGETPEQCLVRELREELGIETEVGDFITASHFHYKEKNIRLLGYLVEYVSGEIVLNAHEEIKWVGLDDLRNYDFADADFAIVKELLLHGRG
jgi:8-oxo-dGTP diphosphatase